MVSPEHELPIAMARLDPELLPWLLSSIHGFEVPAHAAARPYAGEAQKTVSSTYHADSVIVFHDVGDQPVLAVVWEVQRRWDPRKRLTWRLYLAHTAAELEVPVELLVYCPTERLAARYRELLSGESRTAPLRPFFVTPGAVPLAGDGRPLIARVMGVLAHRADPKVMELLPGLADEIVRHAEDRWTAYYDIVLAALPPGLRNEWEVIMTTTTKSRYYSEKFQKLEAEGIAKGKAEALVDVLVARGFELSSGLRARVLATTDGDQLSVWMRRAATTDSLDEVFG